MKYLKRSLLIFFAVFIIVLIYNYRKLNIIAGYAAKNVASSVFLADRSIVFTNETDTNYSPISIATNTIDKNEKSSESSVFGLLTRKAVYREGLGSVLTLNDKDISYEYLIPKRTKNYTNLEFPYGNKNHKDTLFSSVKYDKLQQAIDTMFAEKNQTRAVLVIHKDKIIAEKYAENFDKDSRLLGWSMAKSVTVSVFGVLEYQGKLNINEKAPIKEWQNDARKEITINNLLQMRSGLEWDESYTTISDVTKMLFLEGDMSKPQIYKPLVSKPNETTNYSSGTTNLLSGLLKQYFDTHQEYLDFWYTDLIDKIGMHSMTVEADLNGNYVGSSYAWATARDWSKLGLLYLHKGNWNGNQIFSKNWVDYATKPGAISNDDRSNYNNTYPSDYGIVWLNAGKIYPDVPASLYSFNGHQGQYVFVLPEQDLVIVRMGLTKNADLNQFISGIVDAVE